MWWRAFQDPDDKYLDEVDMAKTKVGEFDDLFESAADPLNSLVDLNNALAGAVDDTKAAVASLQGALKVGLNASGGSASFELAQTNSETGEDGKPDNSVLQKAEANEAIKEVRIQQLFFSRIFFKNFFFEEGKNNF